MKLETVFLKYVYRNIGIISYLIFITFCFYCFSIITSSHPNILVSAISDFGIYDETKWIFVLMCTTTAFGMLLLFKEVLQILELGKSLFVNAIAVLLCASFIGVSLTPYTYFPTPHTIFAFVLMGGFGAFIFLLALIKRFRGKFMIFSGIVGLLDVVFIFTLFPSLVKSSGGWLLPETIILTMMGSWIVVSEMFLKERTKVIK